MVKVKNDGHIMWLQLGHTNSEPGYVSCPNKGRGRDVKVKIAKTISILTNCKV